LKFLDARLERLHRDGTLHLLLRERERDELDDDGEDEDRVAVGVRHVEALEALVDHLREGGGGGGVNE
jgi:hypothetical protein